MTITVLYSCPGCATRRAAVQVRARDPSEDVADWMDATTRAVALDHRTRHPTCRSAILSELLIPMTGTRQIGGPIEH